MAYPEPTEVAPWYLRNITQALALDETTGNVYVRTDSQIDISNANVIIGNVGITSLGNVDISGNTMPVSGTITVDTITGNVTVLQGTDPWIVSGNVNANITGTANVVLAEDANVIISGFGGATGDAFGRLRVSNPYTLFDTRSLYYDHEQFASNVTGTGNVVYNANSSSYTMTVTGAGAVYRETYKTFIYQPGKSLLIMNSFCGNTATDGLTQRVGYFNDENGIFFETDGETLNMVIRSSSTGSVTHERVAQSAWNGDRLNGLGGAHNPSGANLNPALTQLFWTDLEWLGVGSVRVGFVLNGQYIICHTFNHANQTGNTIPYMGTAVLPCRYELISTGPSATMCQVCSTVISEGGYPQEGRVTSVGHGFGDEVDLPNNDSFVPLISIRLKSTMPDAVVVPKTFSISVSSNDLYMWKLYRRAVTTGGSWVSAGDKTAVEYNLAPTALVSGDLVDQGYIRASNQSVSSPGNLPLTYENQLFRDPFTNTFLEFVLMAATDGTNQTALAAVQWQDIS